MAAEPERAWCALALALVVASWLLWPLEDRPHHRQFELVEVAATYAPHHGTTEPEGALMVRTLGSPNYIMDKAYSQMDGDEAASAYGKTLAADVDFQSNVFNANVCSWRPTWCEDRWIGTPMKPRIGTLAVAERLRIGTLAPVEWLKIGALA